MNCIMINLDSRQGYQLKTHSSLQDKQNILEQHSHTTFLVNYSARIATDTGHKQLHN